jgi:hypothetical protein
MFRPLAIGIGIAASVASGSRALAQTERVQMIVPGTIVPFAVVEPRFPPIVARSLASELRNAQLRRKRLLEKHGGLPPGVRHPEVLKVDLEIKAIEESIQRIKLAPNGK